MKNSTTTERLLMIYVIALRESYNNAIVDQIILIKHNFNLSDAMKKGTIIP